MTEQILALARTLGPAGVTETEALEPLCRAARAELEGMLREGVTHEDCGEAFLLGAAWLALAGLAAGEDGGVESFRAGDVSIRHRSGTDARARCAALRLQARQVMARYLRDDGFVFRGVPG